MDVSVLSVEKKTQFEAEARAIRAYNYLYLSKVFVPVPMLLTGETYTCLLYTSACKYPYVSIAYVQDALYPVILHVLAIV